MAALALIALPGCVVVPPPAQTMLAAYPGPRKTELEFAQDDAACQAMADRLPPASAAPAGAVQPGRAAAPRAVDPAVEAVEVPLFTPGTVYLRCMVEHDNRIQPILQATPASYRYYAPYPVFAGYGGAYPGDGYAFGLGYFGGYRSFGYREGYRGYPFRGGEGFRGGWDRAGYRR